MRRSFPGNVLVSRWPISITSEKAKRSKGIFSAFNELSCWKRLAAVGCCLASEWAILSGNPGCLRYGSRGRKLTEPFFAELLQPVLFERNIIAKEASLAAALFVVFIANCRKLNTADIVCHLKQPVGSRSRIFVNDRIFGNRFFNYGMHRLSYDLLPIVVIDFDAVVLLKKCKVVPKEDFQFPFHSICEAGDCGVFAFLENESLVLNRAFLGKNAKPSKKALPGTNGVSGVLVVASQNGCEMERFIGKASISERPFEACDVVRNVIVLIVENERQQIEPRTRPNIAGFIDEYRQLPHKKTSVNKNAGGNPPALGQPSIAERCPFYTTGQGVFSRCNYSKHMFDSQSITAGKRYGKVA